MGSRSEGRRAIQPASGLPACSEPKQNRPGKLPGRSITLCVFVPLCWPYPCACAPFSGTKNRFAFDTVLGSSVQKLFFDTFCHTRFGRYR